MADPNLVSAPSSPGPGWVLDHVGKYGGQWWRYTGTGQQQQTQATPKAPAPKQPAPKPPTPQTTSVSPTRPQPGEAQPKPPPKQPAPQSPSQQPSASKRYVKGTPFTNPPPDQAQILSKINKEANNRDLNDAMRELRGVSFKFNAPNVPINVANRFDAHGTNTLSSLTQLLNGGIQGDRTFYTENLAGAYTGGMASGGAGGLRDSGSSFVVLSHPGQSLDDGGIGGVVVDPLHAESLPDLRKAFPGVKFISVTDAPTILPKVAAGAQPVKYPGRQFSIEGKTVDARFGKLLALALEETDSIHEATVAACIAYEMQPDAQFGMVGDEWHGPEAPGPGWVQVGKGPHGGLIWKQESSSTQAAQQTSQKAPTQSLAQTRIEAEKAETKQKLVAQAKHVIDYDNKMHRKTVRSFERPTTGVYANPNFAAIEQEAMKMLSRDGKTPVVPTYLFVYGPEHGSTQLWSSLFGHEEVDIYRRGDKTIIARAGRRPIAIPDGSPIVENVAKAFGRKPKVENPIITDSLNAQFAHDIHDLAAQGILNRAVEAAKKLSAQARKDLTAALSLTNPDQALHAVVSFLERYRVDLARLLGVTQLAAILEGAREVAAKMPVIPPQGMDNPPPSLGPHESIELVDRLRSLDIMAREEAIYALPPDQQRYVRQAIVVAQNPPPPLRLPAPAVDDPEHVQWPVIEEAVRLLSEKNVVDRVTFDRMDAQARAKAFMITGIDARETITKFRDALAQNVAEGPDYETFRQEILATVDEAGMLAPHHLELVYRNAIQTAFSDGQMSVLSHPFVRSGFPYSTYDAIHDDRVRPNHLALEKLGIQETNIYRMDDPVFQRFRPPWADNDRCGWTPLTVRQAADRGITEAQEWLRTGSEPERKAWVKMPDFAPDPRFDRGPMSVQLALLSAEVLAPAADAKEEPDQSIGPLVDPYVNIVDPVAAQKTKKPQKAKKQRKRKLGKRSRTPDEWRVLAGGMKFSTEAPGDGWIADGPGRWRRGVQFGMVGDEWHGPNPPGPGWVQVGVGKLGGKIWKYQGGEQPRQDTPKIAPQPAAPVQPPQPQRSPQEHEQALAADIAANPLLQNAVGDTPSIANDPNSQKLREHFKGNRDAILAVEYKSPNEKINLARKLKIKPQQLDAAVAAIKADKSDTTWKAGETPKTPQEKVRAGIMPFPIVAPLPDADRERGAALMASAPEENVDLSSLLATQSGLHFEGVRQAAAGGGELTEGPIEIVRKGGKNYIAQGHHRAAAEVAKGKRAIKAKVVDLDKPASQVSKQPVKSSTNAKTALEQIMDAYENGGQRQGRQATEALLNSLNPQDKQAVLEYFGVNSETLEQQGIGIFDDRVGHRILEKQMAGQYSVNPR